MSIFAFFFNYYDYNIVKMHLNNVNIVLHIFIKTFINPSNQIKKILNKVFWKSPNEINMSENDAEEHVMEDSEEEQRIDHNNITGNNNEVCI